MGGSGIGITSDTSPPSVYSATEDFLEAFWGSAAITIFSPEHTALHVQLGRVPTSAGSRAVWVPLLVPTVGGGVLQQGQARGKSPLLVSAGERRPKT